MPEEPPPLGLQQVVVVAGEPPQARDPLVASGVGLSLEEVLLKFVQISSYPINYFLSEVYIQFFNERKIFELTI